MKNIWKKKKSTKFKKHKEFTPERALKIGAGVVALGVVSKLAKDL